MAGEAKSTEKKTDKRRANLKPAWKPGQSGNPSGRPLGTRNRKTVIMDALIKIAQKKEMPVEELEESIHAAAIGRALKGDVFNYHAIADGLYGKVTDKVDLTSGGKTLADVIAAASHERRRRTKEGTK